MLPSATIIIASDPLLFEERKDKMCRYFGDLARRELEAARSPQELYDALDGARLRTLAKSAIAEDGSPRQERLKRRGEVVIAGCMNDVAEQFEGVRAKFPHTSRGWQDSRATYIKPKEVTMANNKLNDEFGIKTSSDADRVKFHAGDMFGYETAVEYENRGRKSRPGKFSLLEWLCRLFR